MASPHRKCPFRAFALKSSFRPSKRPVSDAAKSATQHRDVKLESSPGGMEDHLIVHPSADAYFHAYFRYLGQDNSIAWEDSELE